VWCARQTSLVPCSKGSQEIRVEGEARAWRLALLACGGVAVLGRREGGRGDGFRWKALVRVVACLLCGVCGVGWVGG